MAKKIRVLVTGGRNFNDYTTIYHTLDDVQDEYGPFACLITGDCPTGADHWAESWAWMQKLKHLKFGADWIGYGRAAGPIRNQIMVDEGKPDLALAFPGGKGTADTIKRCHKATIKVIEVNKKAPPRKGFFSTT